ncbi:MAG: hypothetical protein H6713_26800 [Myxococcales bacterium]|nr:hypothetical protein [Myxococcales bacterium]MCB9753567.1 hypothetical protein [Myxococcales bacterium]
MTWKHTGVLVAICFVLGLGLTRTIRPARACSCTDEAFWKLELTSIDGDGDRVVEEAYWEQEMWLSEGRTSFNLDAGVELRRLK